MMKVEQMHSIHTQSIFPANHDATISLTIDCYANCDAYYFQYVYLFMDGDGSYATTNTGTLLNGASGFGNTGQYILDLPMYGYTGPTYDSKTFIVAGSAADTFDLQFRAPSPSWYPLLLDIPTQLP